MSRNIFLSTLFAVALICLTGCNNTGVSTDADDDAQASDAPKVKVETSEGDFVITLMPDKASETVAQFLENVNNGIYNDSIVHEVAQNNMILIGGVKPETGYPDSTEIPNEATPENSNKTWTVAMLHAPDKTESDSVQFFINMKDNVGLDAQQGGEASPETCGYCVFGIITDGFDVLEKINMVNTTVKGDFEFAPEEDITITKMSVL